MIEPVFLQGTQEALLYGGVVIPLDAGVITPAIHGAILAGRFETEEATQIPRIVRPGDRVLEIGAGIGFISTLLSRQRRVSRVIAVEANPHLIDYMARLHACNRVRKIRRINAVLTNDTHPTATFYIRRDFWMGSLAPIPNPYLSTVEVPTLSLDKLLRDEGIDLVVCDVEGAETVLFQGADLSGVDRIFSRCTTTSPASRAYAAFSRRWPATASSTTRATRRAASCSSNASAPSTSSALTTADPTALVYSGEGRPFRLCGPSPCRF